MKARVLAPGYSFAALSARLRAEGWRRLDLPGLLAPLRSGEPELARFEQAGAVLDYSYNPAIDLRILTGPAPSGLPELTKAEIAAMIASGADEQMLCGALAAAALGLRDLQGPVLAAAKRASPASRPLLLRAAARLATVSPVLAPSARTLRWQIAHGPDAEPAIEAALRGAVAALALTAAIGAARLQLTRMRPALAVARCLEGGEDRRARELAQAIQRASLATLDGGRPGPDDAPRNRLWRSVLGEDRVDGIAMAVAAHIDLVPEPGAVTAAPGSTHARRVGCWRHWLGHEGRGGVANPVRRWTPERAFDVMTRPLAGLEAVEADLPGLLAAPQAAGWRLPTADEWEAAMRGPDGRSRPWGNARRPVTTPVLSPWGIEPAEPGRGEWTSDGDGLVICGTDRSGVCAWRIRPEPGARYRLRLVAPV